MKPRHSLWLIGLLFIGASATANDEMDAPSEAFLEFLGSWETAEGEWISPHEIAEMVIPEMERDRVEEQENQEVADESE